MVTSTRAETVVVLDAETTGTDAERDEIIEFTVQWGLDGSGGTRTWRVNPYVAISASAMAVHGITPEMLAGCPRFEDVADEIRAAVEEADVIVGYSVGFDLQILRSQCVRNGLPVPSTDGAVVLDGYRLWQRCEPRTLQDAHRRFVGIAFEGAHGSAADVAATGRVVAGMVEAFGLAGRSLAEIAAVAEPERAKWIGPTHHIQWDDAGYPVFGFGKHAGKRVSAMARDGAYLQWILGKSFPGHIHEICRQAMAMPGDEFRAWTVERFGGPQGGGNGA